MFQILYETVTSYKQNNKRIKIYEIRTYSTIDSLTQRKRRNKHKLSWKFYILENWEYITYMWNNKIKAWYINMKFQELQNYFSSFEGTNIKELLKK